MPALRRTSNIAQSIPIEMEIEMAWPILRPSRRTAQAASSCRSTRFHPASILRKYSAAHFFPVMDMIRGAAGTL
jgi:hypothetical protein